MRAPHGVQHVFAGQLACGGVCYHALLEPAMLLNVQVTLILDDVTAGSVRERAKREKVEAGGRENAKMSVR